MSDPLTAVINGYRIYREMADNGWTEDRWPSLDAFVEAGWKRSDVNRDMLECGDFWLDVTAKTFGNAGYAVSIERLKLP